MNILYVISEAYPFIKTGGLGDVAGSLPRSINENAVDCRVVIPLYSDIPEVFRSKMSYITNFLVPVGWRQQYCGVFKTRVNDTTYYLLDNEFYFKRPGVYGYQDDGERFAFFSRAVIEMIKYIDFNPHILHANDWPTALVPIYKRLIYGDLLEYKMIKTVFTIHNIRNQGIFDKECFSDIIGLHEWDFPTLEYNGSINLTKAAIITADSVTTVSPTYAQELLNPMVAHGLEGIIQKYSNKINGIINGIDSDIYDPETDESLIVNYSSEDWSGKILNKSALQKLFGLPIDKSVPLIGMVTRFVEYKGIHLVRAIIENLVSNHVQIVMLGTGDPLYETFFTDLANRYPGKMGIKIGFLPDIARKIYAGADMFLMPSQTEPCGISQMVSLRYGTIPIVHETGGLKDTVIDYNGQEGNGFTFQTYQPEDLMNTIISALDLYNDAERWEDLITRAFQYNYSWQISAKDYISLYNKILNPSEATNQQILNQIV